jgi:hypothetical protein
MVTDDGLVTGLTGLSLIRPRARDDMPQTRHNPSLARRVRKARRRSTCPLCRGPVLVGQQIGLIPAGWAHVSPCIVERNRIIAGQLPGDLGREGRDAAP